MIQYQFFPRSRGITDDMAAVVDCFNKGNDQISSDNNNLESNEVLAILRPYFEKIGFKVERGRKKDLKIDVPVLFGRDNKIDKSFFADAISKDRKTVIEIEAGQAIDNHRFLKDIFEASMMFDVEYLVLAVRNVYRKKRILNASMLS